MLIMLLLEQQPHHAMSSASRLSPLCPKLAGFCKKGMIRVMEENNA
jgi:hypothetical protein